MTTPVKLIIGLGNPGLRYRGTRHNAGFLVLDELARRKGLNFRKRPQAQESQFQQVKLIKPLTFMNLSGQVVQAYASKNKTRTEEILIIHDDLDMPLGRLRFKSGGGAGGQKGVADTMARIGPDFLRLKIGIGRPPEGWLVERWVLSRFKVDEAELLKRVISTAADAVELLLSNGLEPAMNFYNGLDLRYPSEEAQESGN